MVNDIITEKFFKDGGPKRDIIAREQESIAKAQAERLAKFEKETEAKATRLKEKELAVKKALDDQVANK